MTSTATQSEEPTNGAQSDLGPCPSCWNQRQRDATGSMAHAAVNRAATTPVYSAVDDLWFRPNRIQLRESIFLDLLRLTASHIVCLLHFLIWIVEGTDDGTIVAMGQVAFDVFFILSGYLISTTLNNGLASNPNYGFREYFIGRFSRIYLPLLPCLLLILLLDTLNFTDPGFGYGQFYEVKHFVGNLFMLQDFPALLILARVFPDLQGLTIECFGSARILWSLSVEWWLYMFWGWLMLVVVRKGDRSRRSLLILIFLSIVPVANMLFARGGGSLTFFWLIGVGLMLITTHRPMLELPPRVLLAISAGGLGLAVLRFMAADTSFDLQGVIFLAISFGAFIYYLRLGTGLGLLEPWVGFIRLHAGATYALYLVHYSIMDFFVVRLPTQSRFVLAAISYVLSIYLALFIYRTFDRRHKQLSEFLIRRSAPRLAWPAR